MEPGLIKRELVRESGDFVIIRETWDLTVPNCPMLAIRLYTMEKDVGATTVCRDVMVDRDKWMDTLRGVAAASGADKR